jgi:TPR repeat protein
MMTRIAILLTALLALSGVRADFTAGLEAYRSGDFQGALAEWMPLAEQGQVEAEFNVGLLYFHGRGVEADHASAAEWYRRAAEQGYARAQYELGQLYERGDGVPQDLIQAYKWFRLANREKYEDARKRRKRVADKLSEHDLAQAELQVREWVRLHKSGDPAARAGKSDPSAAGKGD